MFPKFTAAIEGPERFTKPPKGGSIEGKDLARKIPMDGPALLTLLFKRKGGVGAQVAEQDEPQQRRLPEQSAFLEQKDPVTVEGSLNQYMTERIR